jgi:hypothetical protein
MSTNGSGQAGAPPERGGIGALLSAAGAILVVTLGLVFVFIITLVSLGTVPADQKSTVIAAAFTVLGTVVGTYFGVRTGAAGKENAEAARNLESIKVQELAARLDAPVAEAALEEATRRAVEERKASSTAWPAL